MSSGVTVTRIGLGLPPYASIEDLLTAVEREATTEVGPAPGRTAGDLSADQEDAAALAVRAAERAMADTDLASDNPDLGIIVASQSSGIDAVARTASAISSSSYRAVRPVELLELAQTHVFAHLSAKYRATAFAFGTCTGSAAGLDAIALARLAIRSGRAQRVLVVGTEAPGPYAQRLLARAGSTSTCFRGSVAALVTAEDRSTQSAAPTICRSSAAETVEEAITANGEDREATALVFLPAGADRQRTSIRESLKRSYPRARVIDLQPLLGDMAGTLGLLQVALAAAWLSRNPRQTALLIAGSIPDRHIVTTTMRY